MALWLTQSLTEMSTRNISWGQRRPVSRADLTTFMCWLFWNMGASTSWNPQGLSWPVMGLLFFYLLPSRVNPPFKNHAYYLTSSLADSANKSQENWKRLWRKLFHLAGLQIICRHKQKEHEGVNGTRSAEIPIIYLYRLLWLGLSIHKFSHHYEGHSNTQKITPVFQLVKKKRPSTIFFKMPYE